MRVNVAVREAKLADASVIAEIHVASWREAYRGILPASYLAALSVERRRQFWHELLGRPASSKVAVSEDAQGITGFCSYGPTRDDDEPHGVAEIYAIYVRPEKWRGGAGRALCEHAFRDAKARECTGMTAWAFRDNRPACDFYNRMGLAADGAVRTDSTRIGKPLDEIRCRKVFA